MTASTTTALARRRTLPYLLAIAGSAAAAALAYLLGPVLPGDGLLLVLVLLVSVVAWLGGLGPGAAATLLGALLFYARLSTETTAQATSAQLTHVGLFVVVALLISGMSEWRRRTWRQLELTNERLAAALNASRMVAWEWQLPEGTGEIFGDTSLWGVGRAPQSRADVWAMVHPDDRERARTAVEDAIARGDGYVLRYRTVGPDEGSIRWLEAHGRVAGGDRTRLYGVTLDITERVKAEQHLNRTNAILNAFARSTNSVMVVKDRDSRLVMTNPYLLRVLGRAESEVLGRNSVDFFGPERGTPMVENDRRVMESGAAETFEEHIPFSDGLHVYLSTKSPLRDERGQVTGVVVLGIDITERKRIEQALRESEGRLRTLHDELRFVTDTMSAPVCRCARDMTYRWVSRAFAAWVGKEPEELSGRAIADVLGEATFARLRPILERALAGECTEHEHLVDFKGVGARWVHANYTPTRGEGGAVDGWVAVLTDIDQRKREEEALREAARRKDEFLATLAHELRNPLAPLRNGLEILRLTQDAQSAAQVRAMMERQLNQMVRLVDDLLDLSRITRGTVELRLAPCDLAAIVHSAVETSRPVIEARGHRLRVALPEASVELTADAARLSQVLANLLNNSAKYTEPGGEIELSGTCSAGRLTLRVRDPGMGIAPSLIAHVFDPFVQGESPVHRTQGGLGIGLTLVKRLVEMHHGTVEVRSEGPGCGSEFAVHLPLTGHQDRAAQAESPAESADPQSVRVLVADDNVDGAESLARLLDLSGHRVHTVHDGHAAVRVARQLQPEVALLDIGMPGLDGWEVARRIRALPGCEQTLLIALTGWGQAADRSRSREAGFDHHLVKPVDLATLRGLLRAHAANDAIEGGDTPIAVGRGLDA